MRISIKDNGPGIAPDLAGRIFDPFVSTKPEGLGTGLGLTISRRIIEESPSAGIGAVRAVHA